MNPVSQRNFIYFINPISGTANKSRLLQKITDETAQRKISFQIIYTTKEGDYAFLPQKIINEKITDVIICGGDGTIKSVVSFLLHSDVNIGILPVGSGNGLAHGSGIGGNVNKALQIIFSGKTKAIDGFFVNNHFGCMLAGLGFDATVAFEFAGRKKRGLFPYIKISLHRFFASKTFPFVISFDDYTIQTEALFISFANSNQFGSRIKIAPRASLSDGRLDVVVVNKKNKIITALSILRQIAFGKIQPSKELLVKRKNIFYFHAEKLTIKNPSLAPLHIDGEPCETSDTIEVKIIPGAIRLLTP
jgi:diacylglycerol kinase (ATP)